MPVFRGQFFFQEFAQGWTEEWHWGGTDITTAVSFFKSLSYALLLPRSSDTQLLALRASQVDPPVSRVTQRLPINLPGQRPPKAILGTGAEDVAGTCALMSGLYNDGSNRPTMIRGLADDDVTRDPNTGAAVPSPALSAALNSLASTLASLSMAQRRQSKLAPNVPVFSVQAGTVAGYTDLVGPTNVSFAIGDHVKFTGVPLVVLPWLKGVWVLTATAPTLVSIAFPFNYKNPVNPIAMKCQLVSPLWTTFTSWQLTDFRSRKTGRPTALTRGRARGIPYRRSIRAVG